MLKYLNLRLNGLVLIVSSLLMIDLWLFRHAWVCETYPAALADNDSLVAKILLDSQQYQQHQDYPTPSDSSSTSASPQVNALDVFSPPINNASFQRVCLTHDCLMTVGRQLARSFVPVPRQQWCVPFERPETPLTYNETIKKWQSLLLIKVPKTGSSTMAGVVLRIANETGCSVQWEHRQGAYYRNRTPSSIMIGSVRKPIPRTLSSLWHFFFSRQGEAQPSDEELMSALRDYKGGDSAGRGGFQYNYMSMQHIPNHSVTSPDYPGLVQNPHTLLNTLKSLMSGYTFITVNERMDESLVALSFVIGVSLTDVLVTSSKVAGRYQFTPFEDGLYNCTYEYKARPTPNIVQYLESDAFTAMNYADYILYHAADASLNQTIELIGVDRFNKALAEFRALKDRVQDICGERLGTRCTSDGKPILPLEPCYKRDFGCGYKCINEVLSNTPLIEV
jgi:hypothetical protein